MTSNRIPAQLHPAECRPLTSREIAQILCSMLSGVATIEAQAVDEFPQVLQMSTASLDGGMKYFEAIGGPATWRCAVVATVTGFSSWCSRSSIETAVLWISENLPHLFKHPAIAN